MTGRGGILGRVVRDERGIALPVSVTILALTLLIGAVAVKQAVGSAAGTYRDSEMKRALQAADAGLETAHWRMNTFIAQTASPTDPNVCVIRQTDGSFVYTSPPAGEVWCPTGSSEEIGSGESYSYSVSGYLADGDLLNSTILRRVVSTGAVGDVTRRVASEVAATDARRLLSDYAVVSDDDLTLNNTGTIGDESAQVVGNARSNANINLANNASINGSATAGPDDPATPEQDHAVTTANGSSVGSTAIAAEPLVLPPVRMQDGVPNDNDTSCLASGCSGATYTWNPETRDLLIDGGTLTLAGNVFAFCSLEMSGGKLVIQPTDADAPVRIYLGSLPAEEPDHPTSQECGSPPINPDPAADPCDEPPVMRLRNKPEIPPPSATFPTIQLYLAGARTVSFENNNAHPSVPMAVYAPEGIVCLSNHATLNGGIVGKRVSLENNTTVVPTSDGGFLDSVTAPKYERGSYRECTSTASGTDPGSGC